jgi:sugar-specific transcriptional regulator TrmB
MPRTARRAAAISTAPEGLVGQLEGLGLSRNEALAYLTLLEDDGDQGITGYEVAARSGIPRSAVYAVLRKLEALGAAFAASTDPVGFVANDPERWVGQVRRSTLAQLAEVEAALKQLPARDRPEPVWVLRRYDEVMDRIDRMIRGAERSVWLSLWPRELDRLRPAIDAVADRDLHRVLHSPSPIDVVPVAFSPWLDDQPGASSKAGWSHKALVVVDRREALIGGSEPDADNHAVWTTNPSLVDVATNHLILDITLMARSRREDCAAVVAPMMRPHLQPASDVG